ncbi:ROK family protein [Caviibacter abscessus]|uniref:ROK family protein n=1 Tax=Caviibacter abscessus TaxID=1766719 RepID=UPI00083849D1|nr:ROK family protein [Caviibacter abscessus]
MKKLNLNDYTTLEMIATSETMSRIELSRILDVSPPAVSKIIKKLQGKKLLLTEDEVLKSEGGRPRMAIKINKKFKKIIGVNLALDYIDTTVTNLDGSIIETRRRSYQNNKLQDKLIKIMVDELTANIEKHGEKNIAGIGISVVGIVDYDQGIVKSSKSFKDKNLKIQDYIQDLFNIPVIIDNNVKAMLKAENTFSKKNKIKNAMLVYLNNGIGSSFLINGSILRGAHYAAGEIGHVTTDLSGFAFKSSLENECMDSSIIDKINEKITNEEEHLEYDEPIHEIYKKANEGIEPYKSVITDLGLKVGTILGNILNVSDIGDLILAGEILNTCMTLNEALIAGMNKSISSEILNKTFVRPSRLGTDIEKLGSVSLVMSNLFSGRKLIK